MSALVERCSNVYFTYINARTMMVPKYEPYSYFSSDAMILFSLTNSREEMDVHRLKIID